MDIIIWIVCIVIGIGVGYLIFYFRYMDRSLVDDLRKTIEEQQQHIQHTMIDAKEFEEQNRILKTKVSELLLKNDDLTKITSELYRYYHRIKESHNKALELVDMLKSFDNEFDEKMTIHWGTKQIPINIAHDQPKRF